MASERNADGKVSESGSRKREREREREIERFEQSVTSKKKKKLFSSERDTNSMISATLVYETVHGNSHQKGKKEKCFHKRKKKPLMDTW
jgi:hypothetical protein